MGHAKLARPSDRQSLAPQTAPQQHARRSREPDQYENGQEGYSDEGEDFYEYRDLRGKKHVDTDGGHDRPFVVNTHSSSKLIRFPDPVVTADVSFRTYLRSYIPAQLFQNEYGDLCPLEDISTSHIATVQAKLWRELPRNSACISSLRIEDVGEDDKLTADCIELIADTLELNYVFVIRQRPPKSASCSFPLCENLHRELKIDHGADLVTLEPVIDFTALNSASDLHLFRGTIFVFRRISLRYSEYGIDIETMVPKERLAFCVACLQHLWDRRVSAWATKDIIKNSIKDIESDTRRYESESLYTGAVELPTIIPSAVLDFSRPVVELDNTEKWFSSLALDMDKEADTGGVSLQSEYHNQGWSLQNANTVYEMMDGVDENITRGESSHSEHPRQPLNARKVESGSHISPQASPNFAPIQLAARPVKKARENFSIYSPPQWTAINDPLTNRSTALSTRTSGRLPSTQSTMFTEELSYASDQPNSTVAQPFRGTFDIPASEQYPNARAGIPVGPPVEYQWKKGISFPAPPMKDLGPMFPEGTSIVRSEVKDGGLLREDIIRSAVRASGVSVLDPVPEARPSLAKNGLRQPSFNTLDEPESQLANAKANQLLSWLATTSKKKALSPSNPVSVSPATGIKASVPSSVEQNPVLGTASGSAMEKPTDSTTVVNPVRRTLPDSSSQASAETGQTPRLPLRQTRVLVLPTMEPQETPTLPNICSCHKPSLTTVPDRVVTCSNPDCPIAQYHYRCLDKSQKLSTKGTRWTCAMCKAAKFFETLAATKKKPPADFSFPFNAADIKKAFAFPQGPAAVRNPYGIGLDKYNGYDPTKYGVVGHTIHNGEVRVAYGVDPNAPDIDVESDLEPEDDDEYEDEDEMDNAPYPSDQSRRARPRAPGIIRGGQMDHTTYVSALPISSNNESIPPRAHSAAGAEQPHTILDPEDSAVTDESETDLDAMEE